jgi:hypothetical protein
MANIASAKDADQSTTYFLQYINQLGYLIKGRLSNELTGFSQTFCFRKQVAVFIFLIRHRIKLNHMEYLLVFSRTLLGKKDSCPLIGKIQKQNE